MFDYWNSRAYLTTSVAIAWKRGVFIRETTIPKEEAERLAAGEALLSVADDDAWKFGRGRWYPEDIALLPDAFLVGVGPERDQIRHYLWP